MNAHDRMTPKHGHDHWMRAALREAEKAYDLNEVPIGCVIVREEKIIARGHNLTEQLKDATAHAEMMAITAASAALESRYLTDVTLYVTLEPCSMCAGGIVLARIPRLVFGAYDPKGGGVDHGPMIFAQSTCHHRPEVVGGIDAARAELLLKGFFGERR